MNAQHPRRYVTNWEALIGDLRRRGLTFTAIEREVGIPRSTLQGYVYHGAAPKHAEGEVLIAYWMQFMASPREQVPVSIERASASDAK